MRKKRQPLIWMLLCILIFSLATATSSRVQAQDITIAIDGQDSGRIFDGVGALSGGGGTSRLLIDYPPKQRKQILDYLFKPNYGASLQILKVEIGSDVDTTEGAEASAQRTPTDHNYHRGYEWWLMEQAKLRNPHIKLYALEWGVPGWFHGGFWSQDNIHYILNWIKHAQSDHHLHIDYIGGWNEHGYNKSWYEDLKSALKSNGLHTQVVGADDTNFAAWQIATDMRNDPALNQAVDIVGGHYPCAYNGNVYATCLSDTDAQALNKPIWDSEAGSGQYDTSAAALAQTITHGYIDDKITATINWTLVSAWYDTLPLAGDGLMLASQPWSGYYYVAKSIWVVAHMTQFVQLGWRFLDGASGFLAGQRNNGSYLSFKHGKDYSIYIETTPANAAQTVSFQVSHGLSTGTVHVWTTDLSSSQISDWFVQQKSITPHDGSFSLTLQPNHIYSLTTTSGQGKGTATPPAQASWKLPYRDNFKHYRAGQIPRYFSTVNGAYETAPCASPHKRMCLRQIISIAPIRWEGGPDPDPLTVVGDPNWTHYQVSMDALMEQAGYIDLIGGFKNQSNNHVDGYHLHFTDDGHWQLFKEDDSGAQTVLASGITSFGLHTWHHLTLKVKAGAIEASIDNKSLATINDSSFVVGQVGIQVAPWINAQFDNFAVTPL